MAPICTAAVMYTFVKRTVPYPGLNTFDAPDREKCTARRTITNTPLQALVLMNDPTYLEAARVLAQRDLHEAGATDADRLRYVFRLVDDREPSAQEFEILSKLYQKERDHYLIEQKRRREANDRRRIETRSETGTGGARRLDAGFQHDSEYGRNHNEKLRSTIESVQRSDSRT